MSTCSQTNTPILNQQEDPCNGIHYSTDCLYYPEEIPYLFTGIETSFTEIVQAMVLSLQTNNTRITQLEEENVIQVNQIETLQVDVDYLQNYTPTLQEVTESGNTVLVDTDVAKGIDITLSNNSTLYQNGIVVTVPVQTGEYPEYNPAPDAFIAVLNGQNPGTLSGQPVGFLADMTGADNYGFIADLKTGAVASVGSDMRSFDSHTGDLYRGTKFISGVPSQVFKVDNDGDVTGKSFIKTGGASSEYLMANGSISTMPTLQQVTTAGATTTNTIVINPTVNTDAIEITGEGDNGLITILSNNGININSFSGAGYAVRAITDIGGAIYAGANDANGVPLVAINGNTDAIAATIMALNGTSLQVYNNSGIGAEVNLGLTGKGIVINSGTSSTGNFIELNKNGDDKLTINQQGEISTVKIPGGTSSQYLMANGTTSTTPTLQQITDAGATTDNTITINTSDSEGLVINASGVQSCISINTPAESPGPYPLVFSSDLGGIYFSVDNGGSLETTGRITSNALVVGTEGIIVNSGGVSISGPVSPETNYQLSLSANSAAKPSTNTWTIASDERVKTNVNPYTKGLETILAINPITYDYNGKAGFDSTNTGNIGVIAQDVLNVIPESIKTFYAKLNEEDEEKTELYNFDSHALTFILINAVKQLSAEIELLKAR